MSFCTVRVFSEKSQKYVLVKVGKDTAPEFVLWGNPAAVWHADIVSELEQLNLHVLEVLGGGRLLVSTTEKLIYVWGQSDRYGLAPIRKVEELLTSHYPDYKIVTDRIPI